MMYKVAFVKMKYDYGRVCGITDYIHNVIEWVEVDETTYNTLIGYSHLYPEGYSLLVSCQQNETKSVIDEFLGKVKLHIEEITKEKERITKARETKEKNVEYNKDIKALRLLKESIGECDLLNSHIEKLKEKYPNKTIKV